MGAGDVLVDLEGCNMLLNAYSRNGNEPPIPRLYDYKFAPWRESYPPQKYGKSTWHKPRTWDGKACGARLDVGCIGIPGPHVRPRVLLTVDPFDAHVPKEWRNELFGLMEECCELDWLVLTKHPDQVVNACGICCNTHGVPKHIFLGVNVHTQAEADMLIPQLLQVPAKTRFAWVEPTSNVTLMALMQNGQTFYDALSGQWRYDDFTPIETNTCHYRPEMLTHAERLQWVIVAGGDKPMHPHWALNLRDQAKAARVPFWFDGWGKWSQHRATHALRVDGQFMKRPVDHEDPRDPIGRGDIGWVSIGKNDHATWGRKIKRREYTEVPQ